MEAQIILIDKPFGWTSFDVVKKVRNHLSHQWSTEIQKVRPKVGHAGTLDPLATGLLILCTGALTKKISEIQSGEKEYTGTFTLGASRPSFDLETEINQTFSYSHINPEKIYEAANQFIGESMQVPPTHSAVKIDGVRAYKKARKGHVFEPAAKPVFIREFEITSVSIPNVGFRIVCSKGTYIRSLADSFGKALQSGSYLSSLCRTRIGSYLLSDAFTIENFLKMDEKAAQIHNI